MSREYEITAEIQSKVQLNPPIDKLTTFGMNNFVVKYINPILVFRSFNKCTAKASNIQEINSECPQ